MLRLGLKHRLKKIGIYLSILGFLIIFNYLLIFVGLSFLNNYQRLYAQLFINTQQELKEQSNQVILGEARAMVYEDARVKALEEFFIQYNSPLLPYAEKIVEVSDQYEFHYGLLPAIAMVESGLCEKIPANSHNCWGWGIYGKTVIRFVSYDEAIEKVAKGIKTQYIDQGLVNPKQIMFKYSPNNKNNWSDKINFFLNNLE